MTGNERSIDGEGRVSGGITFVNDVRCEGALHAAFTLSTVEHAEIRKVDLSPALALPGVVAGLSGADIGPLRLGRAVTDYPVLAHGRALFVGQRVAAIAAVDRDTARRAAELVDIDYSPLPAVRDVEMAVAPGTAGIHPDYDSYRGAIPNRPHPNVQGVWELSSGDAAAAFEECDEVIETTYRSPRMHSASLEPHACLIVPSAQIVHVYSTHKAPYELRRDLARLSGRDESDFTIHPAHIGGDFGSKGFPHLEVACYLLAMATGRPVRCVLSYYEVLTATGSRHPTEIRLRSGMQGTRLHAHRTDVLLDGGAFAALKAHPLAVVPAIRAPVEVYDIPNVYERCECRYTNSLPGAHVRSPGEFQAAFAGESHVDQLARARSMDPIEFRLANTDSPRLRDVLLRLKANVEQWRHEIDGEANRGIGVAVCFRDAGTGSTTASCYASRNGRIEIRLATPDQGAGSLTLFRRLAASTLGVSEHSVSVRPAATDQTLTDSGAGASRVTAVAGRATVKACQALLEELGGGPEPDSGESEDGSVAPTPDRGSRLRQGHWIKDRLEKLDRDEVEAFGTWSIPWPPPPDSDVRSYGAVAVDVSVDTETGQFQIRRAVIVIDTGVVINPIAHRGQVEGGFVYGLSQATLEELVAEDGQIVTASLGDYRIMSAADVPPLEVVVIDSGDDIFSGMRSVGELANVCAGPALANALEDAVGIRVSDLPITAERVRRACVEASTPAAS